MNIFFSSREQECYVSFFHFKALLWILILLKRGQWISFLIKRSERVQELSELLPQTKSKNMQPPLFSISLSRSLALSLCFSLLVFPGVSFMQTCWNWAFEMGSKGGANGGKKGRWEWEDWEKGDLVITSESLEQGDLISVYTTSLIYNLSLLFPLQLFVCFQSVCVCVKLTHNAF